MEVKCDLLELLLKVEMSFKVNSRTPGLPPHISLIGMCRPEGYNFCVVSNLSNDEIISQGPGARFSKAPIVNGPVKLLLFKWNVEV